MTGDDDDDLEITGEGDDTPADSSAADSRAYTRKLNDLERLEADRHAFWKEAFGNPFVRQEMWGILADAHTFEERFACGPNGFPQPEATWFHAGEQAFGLRLFLRWQQLDPDGVRLMLMEHDPRFKKPPPPKRKRRSGVDG